MGQYALHVKSLNGLIWKSNPFSKAPNLYVEVQLDDSVKRTRIIKKNLSPIWNETLILQCSEPEDSAIIRIRIVHKSIVQDKRIASRDIPLLGLLRQCSSGKEQGLTVLPNVQIIVFTQKLLLPGQWQDTPIDTSGDPSAMNKESSATTAVMANASFATRTNTVPTPDNPTPTIRTAVLALSAAEMDRIAVLKRLDISNQYSIDSKPITKGGNGNIYKGKCYIEDRGELVIAAKELQQSLQADERIKTIFEKEVYVWAKLDHPNILPLLGYIYNNSGDPLLVSEWMDNGSASKYVKNMDSGCDVLHLVKGIAYGLSYLHGKNVIHSDIKPDNILINGNGDAMICDFGCSRIIDASLTIGLPTMHDKGTWNYLAPEIFDSNRMGDCDVSPYTKETDVWGFGMTVYELLTHVRPFETLIPAQIFTALVKFDLPSLPSSVVHRKHPEALIKLLLWSVCQLCWKRESEGRPTMSDLVAKLDEQHIGLSVRDIDPVYLPPEMKAHGHDWSAVFNPDSHCSGTVSLDHVIEHDSPIVCTRFSPDGKLLAVGCTGAAHFYYTATGRRSFTLYIEGQSVKVVRFHPDGKRVITAGSLPESEPATSKVSSIPIYVWNLTTREVLSKFVLDTHEEISDLSISNDGLHFVTSSYQGKIRLWDLHSSTSKLINSDSDHVRAVDFSNDGNYIAVGCAEVIVIWSITSMKVVCRLEGHQDLARFLKFMPDGKSLVSGSWDTTLRLWNVEMLLNLKSVKRSVDATYRQLPGHRCEVSCLGTNSDGRYLASSGANDCEILYQDVHTSQVLFVLKMNDGNLWEVDLCPSGDMIATGSINGRVRIWSISLSSYNMNVV